METIKVGDIVRVSKKIPQIYRKVNSMSVFEQTFKVLEIDRDDMALLDSTPPKYVTLIPLKYLVKVNAEPKFHVGDKVRLVGSNILIDSIYTVSDRHYLKQEWFYDLGGKPWIGESNLESYTEPEEPTIAEELAEPLDLKKATEDWAATISNGIREYGENACRIMEEGSIEAYWDIYTADLAKEIALKIAGSQLHNHKPQEIGRMAVEIAKSVVENLKKKEE